MKNIISFLVFMGIIGTVSSQSLNPVRYSDGDQVLNGFVTDNAGQNLPGVLILHAWMGIDDEAKTAAFNLEKEGYIAFVADIYGDGNIPTDNSQAAQIAGQFRSDYELYQRRISLALDQLKKAGADPERIAVIGYCFGGTGALETARADFDVAGVVSIHGGLDKDQERGNGPITTKVLVENPADDPGVTQEVYNNLVKELNDGNADWQIITYAHSGHTFTNPASAQYNEIMAKRAWNHTLLFLKELFE